MWCEHLRAFSLTQPCEVSASFLPVPQVRKLKDRAGRPHAGQIRSEIQSVLISWWAREATLSETNGSASLGPPGDLNPYYPNSLPLF